MWKPAQHLDSRKDLQSPAQDYEISVTKSSYPISQPNKDKRC